MNKKDTLHDNKKRIKYEKGVIGHALSQFLNLNKKYLIDILPMKEMLNIQKKYIEEKKIKISGEEKTKHYINQQKYYQYNKTVDLDSNSTNNIYIRQFLLTQNSDKLKEHHVLFDLGLFWLLVEVNKVFKKLDDTANKKREQILDRKLKQFIDLIDKLFLKVNDPTKNFNEKEIHLFQYVDNLTEKFKNLKNIDVKDLTDKIREELNTIKNLIDILSIEDADDLHKFFKTSIINERTINRETNHKNVMQKMFPTTGFFSPLGNILYPSCDMHKGQHHGYYMYYQKKSPKGLNKAINFVKHIIVQGLTQRYKNIIQKLNSKTFLKFDEKLPDDWINIILTEVKSDFPKENINKTIWDRTSIWNYLDNKHLNNLLCKFVIKKIKNVKYNFPKILEKIISLKNLTELQKCASQLLKTRSSEMKLLKYQSSKKSDEKKSEEKKSDNKKSDEKKSDNKKSDNKKSNEKKSTLELMKEDMRRMFEIKSDNKKSENKKSDEKKSTIELVEEDMKSLSENVRKLKEEKKKDN